MATITRNHPAAPPGRADQNRPVAPPGRSAVLDNAHLGDIHGALGTVKQFDLAPRRTWRKRLMTLLAIMGPGLIVMVGDNDAGGVSTYVQAGQNYGTSLLWTLILLIPVLIVNQEMCVRLGAVTGVGHARLILERFGKFWGAFSVGDLFILNFLTIVTEFIGVSLAMAYFGVSPYVSVPIAALALIGMTVTGSFRRWERFMYLLMVVNFVGIPLALMTHPEPAVIIRDSLIPHVQGGLDATALLLIIAIVGTTVAPWQLFFQQSNVVDKRITPRWINYERWDTVIGSVVLYVGAAALLIAAAFGLANTDLGGQFTDAGGVAVGLAQNVSETAGNLFALLLLDAAMIGAVAVTLATSYAFGDVFKVRHSLHRGVGEAKAFYGIYSALVIVAAGIVLIPNAPLGLITQTVQALAGVLLPSATVFLLLLCNDKDILGPWVNRRWLNALASVIVASLLLLSLVLVVASLFPEADTTQVALALGGVILVGLLALGGLELRAARRTPPVLTMRPTLDRDTWRMPPLAELPRPVWSTSRKIGMYTLRTYLVVAVLLLVVKVVQLALG
jgi:NRAMP (natural resistance-associated macrophage protein)-like metal ion transporter